MLSHVEQLVQTPANPVLLRHEWKILTALEVEAAAGIENDVKTTPPFPCGICNKGYKTLRGIRRHRATFDHYPGLNELIDEV